MGGMRKRGGLLAGLDVGSHKSCVIVGELADLSLDVVGVGTASCGGLRRGTVINVENTVESIRKAVAEAQSTAGCEIRKVFASLSGREIAGVTSHGVVPVRGEEVCRSDVARVLDAARAIALPADRTVLHVLPQEFAVDGQDGIKEPVGMAGVRLEARVHIVTSPLTPVQNLVRCCNRAGLSVAEIIFSPLAAASAVLTEEERELGVALVDIGGGTTDIVVFHGGAVRHSCVLGLGGGHITNDIAAGLRAPFAEAERIKHRYGAAMAAQISRDAQIEVPSVGRDEARILSRHILCQIIEPRVEEIFTMVSREIIRSGYEDSLASGVVLTGGSALLEGIVDLAEQVLRMPVRVGRPVAVTGLSDIVSSPLYATALGLVAAGSDFRRGGSVTVADSRMVGRIKSKVTAWIREFF